VHATIDRMLVDVKVAAAGGRRQRVGFCSAIRREVPIRTFNDWNDPPPGFCEIDMVAHGGTSVAGSFIQTLTLTDIATGWTECLALVARDGSLVVEAMTPAQSLFPWLMCGAGFDNDSAFMNDVVVPWCRAGRALCHGVCSLAESLRRSGEQLQVTPECPWRDHPPSPHVTRMGRDPPLGGTRARGPLRPAR
jgi:hypothetical protein